MKRLSLINRNEMKKLMQMISPETPAEDAAVEDISAIFDIFIMKKLMDMVLHEGVEKEFFAYARSPLNGVEPIQDHAGEPDKNAN